MFSSLLLRFVIDFEKSSSDQVILFSMTAEYRSSSVVNEVFETCEATCHPRHYLGENRPVNCK